MPDVATHPTTQSSVRHTIFCGQDFLDTQDLVSYTPHCKRNFYDGLGMFQSHSRQMQFARF